MRSPRYIVCYTLDGERRSTNSRTLDKRAIAGTLEKVFPGRRIEVVWLQWSDAFSMEQARVWREGGALP